MSSVDQVLAAMSDLPINDPAGLEREIDRLCRQLDAAGLELGRKTDELGEAEIAYGDAFEDALAQLVEDHADSRLPGEDVRRALIHKRAEVRGLYHHKRRLERRVDAVEKWSRKVEKALNGRQSQLSKLSAEDSGFRSRRAA